MYGNGKVTVIVPAYNEADAIGDVLDELVPTATEKNWEVVVVDDGSSDNTTEIAEQHGANVVHNKHNKGYGASLKHGMRKAKGDIIVFMDADGQHDSCDIERLLDGLKENDMVVGQRSKEELVKHRKSGKWILSVVVRILIGRHVPDINSGFRALYRKDGLKYLPILPNGFSLTTTITLAMMKDGRDVEYIPIKISHRDSGKSTVSYFKDGFKTLLLISRVVMLFDPLKIFAPLAILLLSSGVLYTLYMIIFFSDITETSLLLILSGFGIGLFGLLADQISNIRRGG